MLFREFNREIPDVFCLNFARFFAYAPYLGHDRASFERFPQLLQILIRAHREDFHAAVAPVPHIPVHTNFRPGVLHEIPVAHSLDSARYHVATRDDPFIHNVSSLPEPQPLLPNRPTPLPLLRYTGFQASGGPFFC